MPVPSLRAAVNALAGAMDVSAGLRILADYALHWIPYIFPDRTLELWLCSGLRGHLSLPLFIPFSFTQPSDAQEELQELLAFLRDLMPDELDDELKIQYITILGRVSGPSSPGAKQLFW